MTLRSQTIRLGIFISALILAAIVLFQLVWLRKVYNFEQKEFDHSITKAVRNFYEDINTDSAGNPIAHLSDRVTRHNSQTYLVRLDNLPTFAVSEYDSLAYYMHSELEDEEVFTDCYLSIYDARKNQVVFQKYLRAAPSTHAQAPAPPAAEEAYSHIALYFPYRRQYILGLMNFWLISSALVLFVLVLFGGSLYYFYRQKFLNEIQRDFINNFTHEFKTPVSVINLAAETLENTDLQKKPERLQQYAAIIKYQGQYLQAQIERLLQYAFTESNQLPLQKEEVSLHAIINEALKNLQPLIQATAATIECQFEAAKDGLLSDKGYLLIVVINLVENALKYAQQPKVIVSTYNEGAYVVLSVKDNGRGIEPRYRKRIFKKFYRITQGDQSSGRGFGLGLAFVRRIVDAHHGKIGVESIPQVGSAFIVKLPLLKGASTSQQ